MRPNREGRTREHSRLNTGRQLTLGELLTCTAPLYLSRDNSISQLKADKLGANIIITVHWGKKRHAVQSTARGNDLYLFCPTLIFTVLGAEALLDGHRQALGAVSPGVQAPNSHFSQHPRGLASEAWAYQTTPGLLFPDLKDYHFPVWASDFLPHWYHPHGLIPPWQPQSILDL